MPSITNLPGRAGAFAYDAETVADVEELLSQVVPGQGVQIEDDGLDKESAARLRVGHMQKCLLRDYGLKARGHVVALGGTDKKGKDVGPFMPVVSLPKAKRGDKYKDAPGGANELTGDESEGYDDHEPEGDNTYKAGE